ncbi:MAG: hypothetical protein A3J10_03235 [Candidatus Sungbacteria bacterium RIFCSPLOWO2_02_FULL_54_10]|nr:MAG: hypothetical protein A3C92_00055 [Candidatus Sungbacteria bacterium RIFCSPHIGHO2_02_FULL_53_17]OHA12420.1 MAG: hypothetical protein A3J10_03235 [Candidatus Sungbacteria bacterium RIFCSPLOWO2_02_FULL_54_10]
MSRPFIIATVAEKGGGKGLFIQLTRKILPEKKIVSVRFSDIWREIVHLLGQEESRENISQLATAVRAAFKNEGILVDAMHKRLQGIDADIVILDGLRKAEEVQPMVRDRGGILLYIATSPEARFARRREHAETTDEKGMTWEQFMRHEAIPTETSIRTIGETMADAIIENNGTVEEFGTRVAAFLKARVVPRL